MVSGLPQITLEDCSKESARRTFKEHFGPSPTVVAVVWSDILSADVELGLKKGDKSEKGFTKVLTALHFLWAYPKNGGILASTVGTSKRMVQGENLWRWVKVLSNLKQIKIVWPEEAFNSSRQVFIVSVDGVDFRCWEKSSPEFNVDRGQYSHKFNHGALKYEIAIDPYASRVVWINGPFPGSVHDRTIFMESLNEKIPPGKKVVADRIYGSKKKEDAEVSKKFALPNLCDSKVLANFKTRVRNRHESFNGRLKDFNALSDTYRHSQKRHSHVFEAVCVLVQYEMDNGSPLFDA